MHVDPRHGAGDYNHELLPTSTVVTSSSYVSQRTVAEPNYNSTQLDESEFHFDYTCYKNDACV